MIMVFKWTKILGNRSLPAGWYEEDSILYYFSLRYDSSLRTYHPPLKI
jgi:hypothetical protein